MKHTVLESTRVGAAPILKLRTSKFRETLDETGYRQARFRTARSDINLPEVWHGFHGFKLAKAFFIQSCADTLMCDSG